jgi:hypothetical protein
VNYSEEFRIAKDDEAYPQGFNDAPLDDGEDYLLEDEGVIYYDDYTETDAAMQDLVDDTIDEDRA